MLTEAAALKQIADELKAQGKEFKELPELRQLIEAGQRYQGAELAAKEREIASVDVPGTSEVPGTLSNHYQRI